MRIATGQRMREIDRTAIEDWGMPGSALMEAAGHGASQALLAEIDALGEPDLPVTIVCGTGNNGGDGFVVARHLANHGVDVETVLLGRVSDLLGDAAAMAAVWSHAGIIREVTDDESWEIAREAIELAPILVDAVFGTGLNRPPEGRGGSAIDAINQAGLDGAFVFALDVPSGVVADDGTVPGVAVEADATATFGAAKTGLLTFPAADLVGNLHTIDIGLPQELLAGLPDRFVEDIDVADALAPLPPTAHKGHRGRVLVIAGSDHTPGAAALTAEGALRAGAGLVTVATARSAVPVVIASIREAMAEPLPEVDGGIAPEAVSRLHELVDAADCVVIGPGLGMGAGAVMAVSTLLAESETPLVVDADALNICAQILAEAAASDGEKESADLFRRARADVVLTPHPGEMARLLDLAPADVNARRLPLVRQWSQAWRATIVLKGARTLIAGTDGAVSINPTVHPGLATAGSGDVLAGVIGALLAGGLPATEAAWVGAWLHGTAGEEAARRFGPRGFLARDIAACVPGAVRRAREV